MVRRLAVLAGLIAVLASSLAVRAADYPVRPVSLVVAFTPGGPSDVLARIVGKQMENCDGMILIGRIKAISPDTKAILLVDAEDWPSRIDALDAGADDLQRRGPGGRDLLESSRRLLEPLQNRETVTSLVRRSG